MSTVQFAATKIIRDLETRFFVDFNREVRINEVIASNKMTRSFGLAEKNMFGSVRKIKLSNKAFEGKTNTKAFYKTVVHEFCHHAANVMNGSWDHGIMWAALMQHFGESADRYVTEEQKLEANHINRRIQLKYRFNCGCRYHYVSATIKNRILSGATYRCKACRGALVAPTR